MVKYPYGKDVFPYFYQQRRTVMEREFKGLIFNLDGVICHTDRYHHQAWAETCNHHLIHFSPETVDVIRGKTRRTSLELILKMSGDRISEKEKEEILIEKDELYKSYLSQMPKDIIVPEAVATLDKLKDAGYSMAIGSSSRNTKLVLEKLDLGKYFDAVVDGKMIHTSKPDPEVFLKAASLLGLKPEDCLVIENTESGIMAGKNGGFATAGIEHASGMKEIDYMLADLTDLLLFL